MENYSTKAIRNVCLLGHGGAGKTSLAEALLYITKSTERLGKVTDGNTVCDFDPEEIKRGYSISASLASVNWRDVKINILDTPGYFDFEGEVKQCVRVSDSAVIVVDGKEGVQVGTELAWDYATEAKIPKSFFINRFDDGEARFYKVFEALRDRFGKTLCPVLIPCIDVDKVIGFLYLIDMQVYTFDSASGEYVSCPIPDQFMDVANEYRNKLLESVATTSEPLMEKFFAEEEITHEEIIEALHDGIIHGEIVPVFCGAATKMWGVKSLINTIVDSFPRPTARGCEHIVGADGEIEETVINKDSPNTSLFVFKTVADPFVGKLSFFKVMNGTLKKDMALRNTTTGVQEKFNRIFTMRGKKQIDADVLACGDIGVTAKLSNTNTNDTLTTLVENVKYTPIVYPTPYMIRSVKPQAKGDEDKISQGISKLLEEDRTAKYEVNPESKQMLLYGIGDIHIDTIVYKLKNRYNTSVTLGDPVIAYRETIKKSVQAEGKHKKQSGGSGQYGHVKITFSPGEEDGLTFTESTFGGSVPKQYHPAVEKGLQESMQKGVLAGYPMVKLKADLFDGSYHDVDSNEISFKLAANLAYKDGIPKANPVLLEPVGELQVIVPDDYVGDVMGDLNKRRGRVLGIEAYEKKAGYQTVIAEVPQAEMNDYVIFLRATTQGRGRFNYNFVRYEEVPSYITEQIVKNANNA